MIKIFKPLVESYNKKTIEGDKIIILAPYHHQHIHIKRGSNFWYYELKSGDRYLK